MTFSYFIAVNNVFVFCKTINTHPLEVRTSYLMLMRTFYPHMFDAKWMKSYGVKKLVLLYWYRR